MSILRCSFPFYYFIYKINCLPLYCKSKQLSSIKKLRTIFTILFACILAIYIGLILLLHIPAVQTFIASKTADALTEKIGSKVSIGKVNLGMLNSIIIEDLYVEDLEGRQMIKAARTAASIDIVDAINGKINISSAQLFGLNARISKDCPTCDLNIQFLIDAFKSQDEDKKTTLDLHIGSLIMRHANITYDVLSEPKTPNKFNSNHIDLHDLAITATLKALTDDSLNVTIKRLNATERNSGLILNNLTTKIEADRSKALLSYVDIQTHKSHVYIDSTTIAYADYQKTGKFKYETSIKDTYITPSEFACFTPKLKDFVTPIYINVYAKGDDNNINVNTAQVSIGDDRLIMDLDFIANDIKSKDNLFLSTNIRKLKITPDAIHTIASPLGIDNATLSHLDRLGTIQFAGQASKGRDIIIAQGRAMTDCGNINIDVNTDGKSTIKGHLDTDGIQVGKILANEDFGNTIFDINIDANLREGATLPTGNISGDISLFEYKGYQYHNININGESLNNGNIGGHFSINDPNVKVSIDGTYTAAQPTYDFDVKVRELHPAALHLIDAAQSDSYQFNMLCNVSGKDLNSAIGTISLDSIRISTNGKHIALHSADISASHNGNGGKHVSINSDIINGWMDGNINYEDIPSCFINQVAHHLPSLVKGRSAANSRFDYEFEVKESEVLHQFISEDYVIKEPITINGSVDGRANSLAMNLYAPLFMLDDNIYEGITLVCNSNNDHLLADIHASQRKDSGIVEVDVNANAKNNKLNTDIRFDKADALPIKGNLSATTTFADSIGKLSTSIHIRPSEFHVNDTTWHVQNANVHIYGKDIACNNVKFYHDKQYIMLNGVISNNPHDKLTAELNDIEVKYITDLVDFTTLQFDGRASGIARVSNIYKKPDFSADVRVDNLYLQGGRLGTGHFHANWDEEVEGVAMKGHVYDKDDKGEDRITDVDGYVSLARKYIDIGITPQNTNAAFLNGFIGVVFKDVQGSVFGNMHVVGPLREVNLVGDVMADVDLTLKATKVRYHISPNDTIRMRPYSLNFPNIHLYDSKRNEGLVNGIVTHKNLKNFSYTFQMQLNKLCCYDEKVFNSDKFYGTVYGSGTLNINGSDGHPLNINADITPTKGSVFAYDAATPDAITGSSFITFQDRAKTVDLTSAANANKAPLSLLEEEQLAEQQNASNYQLYNKRDYIAPDEEEEYKYSSDIFMNIKVHMNPDCEIKLRMDNVEDGYISTFGTGTLLAKYHNKSPFTLQGMYDIQGGRYRLYLQDIIFRDLDIQPGSSVVFNGNPFDARIHLLCHHLINSVPLNDLTSSSSYGNNSKVKVICVLDITGKLGNMNFDFDLQLPNVNDETRQLVRSLISTEEEMNMQIIYLLGLGRFYTNEYARATGESSSSQAINTLLSSTISGQINQMLSNVIGRDSKWNFGTGLATGEKGWDDLDVEGILSGSLLNDRLLINGNFGYRDNALTQQANFIGDFDIKWRLTERGNTYLKAYNMTNDRYFTKATLNTQGIGITFQKDFESWRDLFRRKKKEQVIEQSEEAVDDDEVPADSFLIIK